MIWAEGEAEGRFRGTYEVWPLSLQTFHHVKGHMNRAWKEGWLSGDIDNIYICMDQVGPRAFRRRSRIWYEKQWPDWSHIFRKSSLFAVLYTCASPSWRIWLESNAISHCTLTLLCVYIFASPRENDTFLKDKSGSWCSFWAPHDFQDSSRYGVGAQCLL